MGYCVLLAHGLGRLSEALGRRGTGLLSLSLLLLLLLFSWKTVQQNQVWLSREALFRWESVRVQRGVFIIFLLSASLLLFLLQLWYPDSAPQRQSPLQLRQLPEGQRPPPRGHRPLHHSPQVGLYHTSPTSPPSSNHTR